MANDILKPTTIDEKPFPGASQLTGETSGGSTTEIYKPTEIKPMTFPQAKVALGIKSLSFDTELRMISANFVFNQFGAISIGTVRGTGTALTGTGVRISPYGIYGYNAGVVKFSLNAITGDAKFAGTLEAGVIVATGALVVGTNVGLGTAQDSAGVTTIVGNTVTTGYVNALNVTANSVNAGWVYAGGINASQITAGSITVGGSSQPTALIIQHSTNDTNSRLRFEGGSRIWEDSSDRIGINSLGSPMYIYTNSTEKIVIPSSGQVTLRGGVYADGNANVIGTLRIEGGNPLKIDTNYMQFYANSDYRTMRCELETSFYNDGDGPRILFNVWNRDFLIGGGGAFRINGNWKSAIVPTSSGYNALYCMEMPEIWFADFVEEDRVLDPMFEEVTEGECKWVKTEDGWQVWKKRKGASGIRFENKTREQFEQNEKFLSIPHLKD